MAKELHNPLPLATDTSLHHGTCLEHDSVNAPQLHLNRRFGSGRRHRAQQLHSLGSCDCFGWCLVKHLYIRLTIIPERSLKRSMVPEYKLDKR